MPDYVAMYKHLFQSQTAAIQILQKAQQDTEAMYINAPEPSAAPAKRKSADDAPQGAKKKNTNGHR